MSGLASYIFCEIPQDYLWNNYLNYIYTYLRIYTFVLSYILKSDSSWGQDGFPFAKVTSSCATMWPTSAVSHQMSIWKKIWDINNCWLCCGLLEQYLQVNRIKIETLSNCASCLVLLILRLWKRFERFDSRLMEWGMLILDSGLYGA